MDMEAMYKRDKRGKWQKKKKENAVNVIHGICGFISLLGMELIFTLCTIHWCMPVPPD
jgi:hypothetical protein